METLKRTHCQTKHWRNSLDLRDAVSDTPASVQQLANVGPQTPGGTSDQLTFKKMTSLS